ncbi:hypothetical protein B0A55_05530 [Friedmanniomyces simplex]|uniref:Uncharacterized protein n=1 Tax=Friedmanniomyces simplex TaxID=329884 RepID=A0A4U0XAT4_9PEZI|nr:hypothetical protein B0A55_05530 [Friedmanniomyces simplex]
MLTDRPGLRARPLCINTHNSKSPPASATKNSNDPATTFYSTITSPPRKGWLAPPTSPTSLVRDPSAAAKQSIASEFDTQRRRIQELEAEVRSMRLALEEFFKGRSTQPLATTTTLPVPTSYMPSSSGLASPSATSSVSRLDSSQALMSEEDFFKLFVPLEARAGPEPELEPTVAEAKAFAVAVGTHQRTVKPQSPRK